jgi:acetyltransferase-like isoleucine patch superfamily enzyme
MQPRTPAREGDLVNPTVSRIRYRLMQMLAPHRLTWDERYRPEWVKSGGGAIDIGERTYWFGDCRFTAWKSSDRISIGKYCSIASGATLIAGGNHLVGSISTYPFTMIDRWAEWDAEPLAPQHLRIGNDVWVGANATLVGDIVIGDGAVIGAGAVVVRDVPPYAVAAGVPARAIKLRFEPDEIETLLSLRWWEWPEEEILEAEPIFRSRDVAALAAFRDAHVRTGTVAVEPAPLSAEA